jgi:hypothetical protein
MRLIGVAVCSVVAYAMTGFAAQNTQVETKQKISVEGGKSVNVTGCVAPRVTGPGLMLTNVADKSGALHSYILVSDDSDLAKHIGHRVQLSGNVTDRGDAKVTIETKTKTKVEHGDDQETKHKSEVQGNDVATLPYLGVKSFKMIAAVCP